MTRSHRLRIALLAAVSMMAAACGGTTSVDAPTTSSTQKAGTLRVPADFPTIQDAVDAAKPGALILIAPGIYNEGVTVETEDLTIRGEDRNTVILDGGDRFENGVLAFSNGTVVENLTARNFKGNGVMFSGSYGDSQILDGFRGSYLTVYNNGLYGVYAFAAKNGQIDHVYGSGHPDSAVYVGQCNPCNTTVTDSVGELNAVGFQGTNAGGGLIVTTSVWSRNRVGIESTSSTREQVYPQRNATFVANLVSDNNGDGTPQATDAAGVGIALSGGQTNIVDRNVIVGNAASGVIVTSGEGFEPKGNTVKNNTLAGNGVDLVFTTTTGAQDDNCFENNQFTTSSPTAIEQALVCNAAGTANGTEPTIPVPTHADYRTVPAPGPQQSMPNALTAKAKPARGPLELVYADLTAPDAPEAP
ncbi:MAG TPA: right-handed parallel beta-helix repeat-containing protein [Microthrixaceae bacterium]|nr:right-handed parallel beta-helix repeat-containing protein [Microthrixaceae bacterium]